MNFDHEAMKRFARIYLLYWVSLPIAVAAQLLASSIGDDIIMVAMGSFILFLMVILAIVTEEVNRAIFYQAL